MNKCGWTANYFHFEHLFIEVSVSYCEVCTAKEEHDIAAFLPANFIKTKGEELKWYFDLYYMWVPDVINTMLETPRKNLIFVFVCEMEF